MNTVLNILLAFLGIIAFGCCGLIGQWLCYLPARLFLSKERAVPLEEFCSQASQKARVVRVLVPVLALVGLAVFAYVSVTAFLPNVPRRPAVFLMWPPLGFLTIYAPLAGLELAAGTSIVIPFGLGTRRPVLVIESRRTVWAGLLRLAIVTGATAVTIWLLE